MIIILIFVALWEHFGSTLGARWEGFGSTLEALWGHFGSTLVAGWDHFGSVWQHFGGTLCSTLDASWEHVGNTLGGTLGALWIRALPLLSFPLLSFACCRIVHVIAWWLVVVALAVVVDVFLIATLCAFLLCPIPGAHET